MSAVKPPASIADRARIRSGFLAAPMTALLAGCIIGPAADRTAPHAPTQVGVANPATTACIRAGGVPSTERSADGGERGLCRLPSGQICDQWAFFRAECGPGEVDRRPGS